MIVKDIWNTCFVCVIFARVITTGVTLSFCRNIIESVWSLLNVLTVVLYLKYLPIILILCFVSNLCWVLVDVLCLEDNEERRWMFVYGTGYISAVFSIICQLRGCFVICIGCCFIWLSNIWSIIIFCDYFYNNYDYN